ncbi:hypothetical protein IE53DRAFT_117290 [Violaceomyces palustris]|uniref:Uncharacterized protein n=1 Tax=Violaceomyces palustris TaxID=1673888 RepID=A0ACD0P6J9_9BASI|nr:hypothetical protein IE53DRAFT_117290 [Violaceomyces palustris]
MISDYSSPIIFSPHDPSSATFTSLIPLLSLSLYPLPLSSFHCPSFPHLSFPLPPVLLVPSCLALFPDFLLLHVFHSRRSFLQQEESSRSPIPFALRTGPWSRIPNHPGPIPPLSPFRKRSVFLISPPSLPPNSRPKNPLPSPKERNSNPYLFPTTGSTFRPWQKLGSEGSLEE